MLNALDWEDVVNVSWQAVVQLLVALPHSTQERDLAVVQICGLHVLKI